MAAVFSLPGNLVSPVQRLTLLSLANHSDQHGRNAWPSRATIGDETGLSVRTVTRALFRQLRGMGLLTVAQYPGRNPVDNHYEGTFVYDIHIPGLSTGTPSTPGHTVHPPSQTP